MTDDEEGWGRPGNGASRTLWYRLIIGLTEEFGIGVFAGALDDALFAELGCASWFVKVFGTEVIAGALDDELFAKIG